MYIYLDRYIYIDTYQGSGLNQFLHRKTVLEDNTPELTDI